MPAEGRTGWPWIIRAHALTRRNLDTTQLPKISIVTPSYNQAQYLEETIRSVLLQGDPNLEDIIIDGGSMDGSVDIIKKYEPWLTYWESNKDKGQSSAINKGFELSTGAILAWINSDDYYMPGVFFNVAEKMAKYNWVSGKTQLLNFQGEEVSVISAQSDALRRFDKCFKNSNRFDFRISQPSHFWSREMIDRVGFLNENYHFGMDFDWMLRALALGYHPLFINQVISCIRYHPETKTNSLGYKFNLDWAHSLSRLGISGTLKFFPSIKLSRFYYARYLRGISDRLFSEDRRFLSFFTALSGWLLTSKKIGENYLARLKRVF